MNYILKLLFSMTVSYGAWITSMTGAYMFTGNTDFTAWYFELITVIMTLGITHSIMKERKL